MVRKKMEGDEDQRRAAAHEARREGEAPSARSATTGASKQRTHVPDRNSLTHEEKTARLDEGKEQVHREGPGPLKHSRQNRTPAEPQPQPPAHDFHGHGRPEYTQAHEEVFRAVVEEERDHDGEAVHLQEIARASGRPVRETRTLLHDLTQVHGLVSEFQDGDRPDMGPRYGTRPGG